MSRALRIEYPGATYHVMSRGNRGARIFQRQEDADLWLKTLGEACARSELRVHAYCLMTTHYHMLLETPQGNLVEGMKWLQGTFTQRYNARRKQAGHLFQGRYKAKVVDVDPGYFRSAGLYILLNPVDAGLVDLQQDDKGLSAWPWSSYPAQAGAPSGRPEWLVTERLFRSLGIYSDSPAGRRAFAAKLKARGLALQLKRLSEEEQAEWKAMEQGWVHGCEVFREAMVKLLDEQKGATARKGPPGQQRRDIGAQQALKALHQAMHLMGVQPGDLQQLRKGDPRKLLLAGWIRRHYPVSAQWCAKQLHMGHPSTITRAWHFYENPPDAWKKQQSVLSKHPEL